MRAERIKSFFGNKTVRLVLVLLAALLLMIVCYRVFAGSARSDPAQTAEESRLVSLLRKIEGVRDATVMITEDEGAAVGAVVVFEGEDGFLVRMRVAEIVAAALGVPERAVLVYPSGS